MKNFKSELLIELQNRGFLKQVSDPDGLDRLIKNNQITGYIGFDLTAPSLHVGSLLQIMLLRWFQKYDNKPLILLGSGTTMIGDPSGKDDTRKMLSEIDIATNKQGILKVFNKFINLDEGKSIIADNKDWLNQINYIDFLRDFGQHFTINRMMSFDSVRLRLEREQPLTFIEFNYMILQAYDFVQLNRIFNCKLQMGGSDQWGNMVNGIELGRRVDSKELFAFTTPLITTSSGTKMGKSVNGAVWLDEDLYSPYDYWQYWRNTEDADVGRFLKFFTDLPLNEIGKLENLKEKELNEAKKILATEVTAMTHGREAAMKASETAKQTFEEGIMSETLPTVKINQIELDKGIGLLNLLVTANLTKTNSDSRRHIESNALKINDVAITDPRAIIKITNFKNGSSIKLSLGKKKHIIIKINQ